ncbi:AglZ/HisF2 family acetamidino modification protein [Endozoicomonas acroporae]|uniref:AglZ/HisF2 family acetamidino modification protein n=1 Tax=Endozoicomonas acroporae TaxID=1701104 RepID=UPI003D7B2DCE
MYQTRVMPCLLIRGNGIVKTRKFKDAVYIGDPVNAVRIFSDKEVDEIVVLDIDASKKGFEPNYDLIAEIAGEAFMPMAYGGGIRTIDQVKRLIRSGVEKVVINTASIESVDIITQVAKIFGSQAVVGAVDVKKTLFGAYRVMVSSGTKETRLNLYEHINRLIEAGVGEIFVNNIDRDGLMTGYDLPLLKSISEKVNVPVVACGGAGNTEHLVMAIKEGGASAVAAGSMFVFHGKHKAVLINYSKELVSCNFK